MAKELNFDGLAGPSHHYGGLSFGNIASEEHEGEASHPRRAALQGLAKMRALHDLGVPQALFPPHMRPELSLARRLGFEGSDEEVLRGLVREAPLLLAACSAASSMWTANSATVGPSADSEDGRVHFTPANLQNKIHRSIEPPTTARILRAIFKGDRFVHHDPLPATAALGDEGAANHTRLAPGFGAAGLHLFVFGESAVEPWGSKPKLFPARQTREASEAIRRLHRIPAERALFLQQNPEVIDQGVFHNDVIAVGHRDVFFHHEAAFLEDDAIARLQAAYERVTEVPLRTIEVPADRVPVGTAVATYLFNSQLVTRPDGRLALVAPKECEESDRVRAYIDELVADSTAAVDEVHYFDLRQSMQGGGGPACLRLRVELTPAEEAAVAPGVRFSAELHERLEAWVNAHYREEIRPRDLADPALMEESRTALDALTDLLGLGSIYPFQS